MMNLTMFLFILVGVGFYGFCLYYFMLKMYKSQQNQASNDGKSSNTCTCFLMNRHYFGFMIPLISICTCATRQQKDPEQENSPEENIEK